VSKSFSDLILSATLGSNPKLIKNNESFTSNEESSRQKGKKLKKYTSSDSHKI
jgi:hypothetical protein